MALHSGYPNFRSGYPLGLGTSRTLTRHSQREYQTSCTVQLYELYELYELFELYELHELFKPYEPYELFEL